MTPIIWNIRSRLSPTWPLRGHQNLERFIFSNSLDQFSHLNWTEIPSIELLIVCKTEDTDILIECINFAVANSANKVEQVKVIVPEEEVISVQNSINKSKLSVSCSVESENGLVHERIPEIILANRPDRFGWIFQQILVCNYLLTCDAKNVLVVDADTLLLRKQIWIDKDQKQILMPSLEFHKPYYEFLRNQSIQFGNPTKSFISHHMLFQTNYFREMFAIWSGDVEVALKAAFANSSIAENSPFDLKYEPYAQFMIKNYAEKINLVKWANLGVKKNIFEKLTNDKEFLSDIGIKYNSVSLHHWSN